MWCWCRCAAFFWGGGPASSCGAAWRPAWRGCTCSTRYLRVEPDRGEWQLLVCAFLFTLQILLVNRFSPRLDGIQLSFVQFLVVSVLSTVCMFLFEQPTLAQFQGAAVSVLYCGVMSSGVAYTLQIVGQKELDPHHRQPGHVPGKRVQRAGGLADPGPDADAPRTGGLRADVCGHRGQPVAGQETLRFFLCKERTKETLIKIARMCDFG